MENPFSKLVGEGESSASGSERGITEDETAKEELRREVEDIERTIREIV